VSRCVGVTDPLAEARAEQERLSRVMAGDHSDDGPEREEAPPTPKGRRRTHDLRM